MEKKVETRQLLSVPGYDPESDPVLAALRSHEPSGGLWRAVVAAAVVGVLAVGGWYAFDVYDSRSREAGAEAELRVQVEKAPAPPPPVSPLQRAEGWCAENLAATEFAELPVVEGQNGSFFVIYTARAGDSISLVVRRYGGGFGSDVRGAILELAKRQHVERYRGRGLWVGDELRLLIPMEPEG